VALIAVPTLAEKPAEDARTAPAGWTPPPGTTVLTGEFLDEGFEGTFPPSGWSEVETAPAPYNWAKDTLVPHSGAYEARIQWTAAYTQDEELIAGPIDLSSASPTDLYFLFWISGSPFWSSNANTEVFISSDGSTWTLVWDALSDLTGTFVWTEVAVDVGAYAGGDLYLRFKYSGTDGADVYLDDVSVGYYTPPVPPLNDTCAGAEANGFLIPAAGPFVLTGNNALASHDYTLSSGSCTGYSATGRDVVWVVDMVPGSVLDVAMTTTGWDDSIYLITDCADPHNTCVAGADAFPDGSVFSYTHLGPFARYYLIVSAYASGVGDFTVTGSLTAPISVESSSWGQVKAQYR
jgi:hypothetical protein